MALDGTYAGLKAAIASWLDNRSDLAGAIPDFVALAEGYFNTETRLRIREAEAETALTPDAGGVCTLPADFAAPREIWAKTSPVRELEVASPSYVRERYDGSVSGFPDVCTIVGTSLTPYPHTTADIGLIYYKTIPALATHPTNWLLTDYPQVYLYATLVQAAPFLGDDARIQTWGGLLDAALARLKASDEAARFSRVRSRVRGCTP